MLKRVIGLLLLAFIWAPAAGAEPLRLTLGEALRLAERQNPEVLTYNQSMVVAAGGVTVAGQRLNPTVMLGVPIGPAERKQSLVFNVPLETGGRREARLAVAESGVREAEFSLSQVRLGILNQTRNGFVELAIAEASRKQSLRDLEFFDRLLDAARRRFEAGDVA